MLIKDGNSTWTTVIVQVDDILPAFSAVHRCIASTFQSLHFRPSRWLYPGKACAECVELVQAFLETERCSHLNRWWPLSVYCVVHYSLRGVPSNSTSYDKWIQMKIKRNFKMNLKKYITRSTDFFMNLNNEICAWF